jgi:arsenate reductase-like glutaredoxin family protein
MLPVYLPLPQCADEHGNNPPLGGSPLNIQIFGKTKCFDTKKAERYFKERRIKFQSIDLVKFGMSKGEYQSVKTAVGGMDALLDDKSKEYESQHVQYLAGKSDVEERLLDNPGMFKTPIVRNGKKATVGYQPDVWGTW